MYYGSGVGMIVDIVSDLHGCKPALQGGDLLIVAGDLTARDIENNWCDFETWICNQNYEEKIIIAGNHDNFLQSMDEHRMWRYWDKVGVTYLCDSGTEFEGLKIWGIPWSKRFIGMNPHCMAFTYDDENWFYDEKIAKIPVDVDILITHSPPYSILDKVTDGYSVGSSSIFNWLKYMGRPRLHVFGHIHEAYGQKEIFPTYNDKMMISVNASIMNEHYDPVNKPVRVIL
jgi:Icc-related predicted phosphoesterase